MVFSWPVRVYYEDTDLGGVVYYANYLKFLERARTEWLRSLGFEQDALRDAENLIFAVRRLQIEYWQAAKFNDELQVSEQISQLGRASFTMQQDITRADTRLCSAQVKLACLQFEALKPCKMPAKLYELLECVALTPRH